MGMFPISKSQMPCCEIRYLIRMLNAQETKDIKIKEISKEDFLTVSCFNITYGVTNEKERMNSSNLF